MGAGISSFFSDDSARRRSTHGSRYGSQRYSRKSTVDTCAQEAQKALMACKARRATRMASVKPPPVNSTPQENTSEQSERSMNEPASRPPPYVQQPDKKETQPVRKWQTPMSFIATSKVQQRRNGQLKHGQLNHGQLKNGQGTIALNNRIKSRTIIFNPTPTTKRNLTTPKIFEDD